MSTGDSKLRLLTTCVRPEQLYATVPYIVTSQHLGEQFLLEEARATLIKYIIVTCPVHTHSVALMAVWSTQECALSVCRHTDISILQQAT